MADANANSMGPAQRTHRSGLRSRKLKTTEKDPYGVDDLSIRRKSTGGKRLKVDGRDVVTDTMHDGKGHEVTRTTYMDGKKA